MKTQKPDGISDEQWEDVDRLNALKTVASSDGGKLLIDELKWDIISAIGVLSTQYGTLSHAELMAQCACLSERLAVLRSLTRAGAELEELKKLLEDTLAE